MLYTNARIFTCEGKTYDRGYIQTAGTVISAVGDCSELPKDSEGVIDLGGRSVYPGFIDAHTHLGMWEDGLGFEGDDGNEETDPSTPQMRAIDAANGFDRCFAEALAAGVTVAVTGPGSSNPIAGQAACVKTVGGPIDSMIIKAPVSMKMALGENPKTTYHDREEAPYTRMATAAIIREQLMQARRYAENVDRAAKDEDTDPPELDMKLEALVPVIKGKLPVHFHAHRRDDIFTAIRIAKEFGLKYAVVHATEGHLCAKELAQLGAKVMSGPALCDRCKPELREQTPAAAGIMAAAGVETAIITDHPVIPIQYLPLCAGLAVREGMDYDDALRAITIVPARILGIDNRVGSIKPGKDADFTVFSGDPLTVSAKPDAVVVGGELVSGAF